MIKRTDSGGPCDTLNRVKVEFVTDKYCEKIQASVYPNYDQTIYVKMTTPGLGFAITKENARNLIEVLQATLRACE